MRNVVKQGATGSLFSRFQKAFVFVGGGAADVADPHKFADVQLPIFIGGIMSQKGSGHILVAAPAFFSPSVKNRIDF